MVRADSVEISDTSFQLHDGRTLAYAEYGVSSRNVLFYFHGGADSRLEARLLAPAATRTGIRLIGVDRPGMGRSSFQKGRRVCDWPDDIVELADYLHIDHFAVVGISGGGPYALACASKIPDRLIACGIVGGEWHQRHTLSSLAQFLPWLVIPILGSFFRTQERAKKALLRLTPHFPEADRTCLARPDIADLFTASFVEAFRRGSRGPAYDGMVVRRPWGFQLEEIRFPALFLWHGEVDTDVPVSVGRAVARQIPHCKATYAPQEGHISLIVNRQDEIVATLLEEALHLSLRGNES